MRVYFLQNSSNKGKWSHRDACGAEWTLGRSKIKATGWYHKSHIVFTSQAPVACVCAEQGVYCSRWE